MRYPLFLMAAFVCAWPFLMIPMVMWANPSIDRALALQVISGTVTCLWLPLWLLIGVLVSARPRLQAK